jgi:hypothetical protein
MQPMNFSSVAALNNQNYSDDNVYIADNSAWLGFRLHNIFLYQFFLSLVSAALCLWRYLCGTDISIAWVTPKLPTPKRRGS